MTRKPARISSLPALARVTVSRSPGCVTGTTTASTTPTRRVVRPSPAPTPTSSAGTSTSVFTNPTSATVYRTATTAVTSRVALLLPRINVIRTDSFVVVNPGFVFPKLGIVTEPQIVTMVLMNLKPVVTSAVRTDSLNVTMTNVCLKRIYATEKMIAEMGVMKVKSMLVKQSKFLAPKDNGSVQAIT